MHGAEIWDKINESANVIAWPGVIAFGMVMFRTKLGELFQRLREAVVPGGSMKFDPSAQIAANQGIAKSGGTLVEGLRAEIEAAHVRDLSEDGDEAETTEAASSNRAVAMSEIKDDVEDLIRASFTAGFGASNTMHRMGGRPRPGAAPEPVIEWDGSVPTVRSYRLGDALVDQPTLAVVELMSIESERSVTEQEIGYLDAEIGEGRAALKGGENDGGMTELRNLELAELLAKRAALQMRIVDLDARLSSLRRRTYGS